MTEYNDVKRRLFGFLDDGNDDEGKKRDFLTKNVGWISLEAFWGVLWV